MAAITHRPGPTADPTPFLLRLYPAAWRTRYGDEFIELLAARPPSLRDRLDIVTGAVDARLNPQLDPRTDREVGLPGDRSIRILTILAGGLLAVWAGMVALFMRPWNSGEWPLDPALMNIGWLAGMAGSIALMAALILIASRYDWAIGSAGAVGAILAGSGLIFASLQGGVLALGMIGVGTALLAWRLRGRLLGTLSAFAIAGATAILIGGFAVFAMGGGQDVRLLWGLIAYGPAWMVVGLDLRAPARPMVVA